MIVWLASYPRSGNTFFRIVLNRLYGLRTCVVYEVDGVAERVGSELVGFQERPDDISRMRESDEVFVLKTHNQTRHSPVRGDDRVVYLVRDGRDSVVSEAHLRSDVGTTGERSGPDLLTEERRRRFETELRQAITRPTKRGVGKWGTNVLSWSRWPRWSASRHVVVRYEHLIREPAEVVRQAVDLVLPDVPPIAGADIPSFAELHRLDGGFFRRGSVGSHRDELPAHLEELFWAQPDNSEAMRMLGYAR
ncbi:sulfotransferase domain-containing protein [Actinopolymorpha rutila]|uniref:Sulfotransferase domain-containing protein n=1 Tax=Actinopolymorpha rutila TaxID=446787 RepID=A0A852Z6Z2_9ACTN|nr:hypothetical protein [Actinopolymorpha rutila]